MTGYQMLNMIISSVYLGRIIVNGDINVNPSGNAGFIFRTSSKTGFVPT